MLIKSPSPTRIPFCAFTRSREDKAYNPDAHSLLSKAKQRLNSENVLKALPIINRKLASTTSFAIAMASMRTWPFYVAVFYSAMSDYLFVTFNATVVAYGVDKGCTLEDSKQVVIFNSVGLLIGRVVIPVATDKVRSCRCPAAVASFLAATICFVVVTQVSTYAGLVAVASIMGVAQGYVLCIKSVIVSDHVGLECFTFCCGVGGLLSVPLWLTGPSIIGFFRDKNGSYDFLYVMLAVLCFVQAVLLGLLTWREAMQRREPRGQRFCEVVMSELQHIKEPCVV
nr:monocarboxylate transporter 10-like isoform X2 [Dermacentor andersoni]